MNPFEQELHSIIQSINPVNPSEYEKAQQRLDSLTKPQGSLGELEETAKRLFGIYRNPDRKIQSKAVFIAAADHGIVEEGVSAYPQEVTGQMLANFVRGGAAASVLSRVSNSKLFVADFGVIGNRSTDGIISAKIGEGTRNFLKEDAMSREEGLRAILSGYRILEEKHKSFSFDLIALGEMGIGNTSSAAALIASLLSIPVDQVTGRGTGLNDETLNNKILLLKKAIAHRNPDSRDPLDVLAKVGGFEIAGLAGMYLACARFEIPCVIDGLISSSAALIAARLCPESRYYFFPSHLSPEPGHECVLDELQLNPLIYGNMRLGEGSGAILAFPLIEFSWSLFTQMATFDSAGVSNK